ncbi:MAG: oligosaccharide flippase family protein [Castellaniella sp.]|uniref:lipopolysaccharide biosynthesis protein n=1 Tax=Castellaniella sp. TaxID=1955812 RepID=UPI003C70B1BB
MAVLLGGTALAQLVVVVALPVLTRVFTPDDFNVYATYIAIVSIIAVIGCLRFDVAIPIPEKEDDAIHLLILSLFASFSISFLLFFGFYFFRHLVINFSSANDVFDYYWLIPIGVWLASTYSALQYWAVRKKSFLSIAKTRVLQSVSSVAVQLGLGGVGIAPVGLLIGQAINGGAGILRLGIEAWLDVKYKFRYVGKDKFISVFKENSKFPKYSVPEELANALAIQAPIIIIGFAAFGAEAGFLLLAMRIMQGPISMLGSAISQVYLSKAPDSERMGELAQLTGDVVGKLFKFGVGPIFFISVVADPLAEFILGKSWGRVGIIMLWMCPWSVWQFMSSPISVVMYVRDRQRAMFFLTLFGLAIRGVAMGIAWLYFKEYFSEFYALSSALFYLICFIVFSRAARLDFQVLYRKCAPGGFVVSLWIISGVVLKLAVIGMVNYGS